MMDGICLPRAASPVPEQPGMETAPSLNRELHTISLAANSKEVFVPNKIGSQCRSAAQSTRGQRQSAKKPALLKTAAAGIAAISSGCYHSCGGVL